MSHQPFHFLMHRFATTWNGDSMSDLRLDFAFRDREWVLFDVSWLKWRLVFHCEAGWVTWGQQVIWSGVRGGGGAARDSSLSPPSKWHQLKETSYFTVGIIVSNGTACQDGGCCCIVCLVMVVLLVVVVVVVIVVVDVVVVVVINSIITAIMKCGGM